MARKEVPSDELAVLAASLRNDSKPISFEAVCKRLGTGTGGNIHQHLQAWEVTHMPPVEAPPVRKLMAVDEW